MLDDKQKYSNIIKNKTWSLENCSGPTSVLGTFLDLGPPLIWIFISFPL